MLFEELMEVSKVDSHRQAFEEENKRAAEERERMKAAKESFFEDED